MIFSGVVPPRAHRERSAAQHLSGSLGGAQPASSHPGKARILGLSIALAAFGWSLATVLAFCAANTMGAQ